MCVVSCMHCMSTGNHTYIDVYNYQCVYMYSKSALCMYLRDVEANGVVM